MLVEALTKIPRPQVEIVQKEFPINQLQIQERVVEVPQFLKAERPKEETVVTVADLITEVLKTEVQYVEKPVPRVETEIVERNMEVPQMLYEERPVDVAQVQFAEQMRQELYPHVQQVVREIPKVKMEYVEKVVEVSSKISSEEVDRDRPPWDRKEQVISSGNFMPRGGSSRSPSPLPGEKVPPVPLPWGSHGQYLQSHTGDGYGSSRGMAGWSPHPSSRARSTSPMPRPMGSGGWGYNAGAPGSMSHLPPASLQRGGYPQWGGFSGGPLPTASNMMRASSPWRGWSPSPMPGPPGVPPPIFQPSSFAYKVY
jgi:hypothetical protein